MKEQVKKERAELREKRKQEEAKEKRALKRKQKQERMELRERQAKERKNITQAGGKREGAGRKPSVPHTENVLAGIDLNPKSTYTFYGAADERKAVKRFLAVWRELRFGLSTEERMELLEKFNALTMYELMTDGVLVDKREIKRLKRKLPALAKYINEIPLPLEAGGGADEQESID